MHSKNQIVAKTNTKENPCKEPVEMYLAEIRKNALLSSEEEIYYGRLVQQGCLESKTTMIQSNLRLVVKIAKRYIRSGMPLSDLIEEGNLGLIRAVEKFNPELGFRFSTYGAYWIQQTIERAIMCQNRTIRLPIHVMKQLNHYLKMVQSLTAKSDHQPTREEISKQLQWSLKQVEEIILLNEKIISVDLPVSEEVKRPLVDNLPALLESNPEHFFAHHSIKQYFSKWVLELPALQKSVIERRFGINGYESRTLEKTGEEIGVTRERVRQLQAEALKNLKKIILNAGEDLNSLLSV